MATLARINIYPFKSLDPQSVQEAVLLGSGALEHDRRFALRDRQGQFVNGKGTAAIHRLRSLFDPSTRRLELRLEGTNDVHAFDVDRQRPELCRWLAEYFETPLELIEDDQAGFPDDTESPGPTLISAATLVEVNSWFAELTLDDVRRRFRANLEVDGVEPFWEDRLVADSTREIRFRVGQAELVGTNPCQRCIVPTRSPSTGEMIYGFARKFAEHRRATLPAWAPVERFDHFYRLSLNTRPATGQQCTIHVGDEVRIVGAA